MADVAEERSGWVARVLGVTVGAPAGGTADPPETPGVAAALAAWKAERLRAIGELMTLELLIRTRQHPDRDGAIMLLRAIRANLTETPETEQQVAELKDYIRSDDIFATAEMPNVFGKKVNIRIPLSTAVTGLQKAMLAAKG